MKSTFVLGTKKEILEINEMPASAIDLEDCEPIYVTMPGFPSHSLEEWLGIARGAQNSEGIDSKVFASKTRPELHQQIRIYSRCKDLFCWTSPDRDAT